MKFGSGAVSVDEFWECCKDALFVLWICTHPSLSKCLDKTAAVLVSGGKGPVDVRFGDRRDG